MEVFSQPPSFIEITPNFDQLLPLGLRKIALSRIFDFRLCCLFLGHYYVILGNYCAITVKNGQNLGNKGKNQKSGSERFFVILRRAADQNLVLFR